jgi:hypothetical protein
VDDVVIKTKDPSTLIVDLKQTIDSLREYKWKLNPTKCVFGVPSGQLLVFLVSHRGIEASTKQIPAITQMTQPHCVKDVQKLTGCMAVLNHFISWLREKGLPFFKLLKKPGKFEWIAKADEAFQRLKEYLSTSLILTPLKK